MLCTRLLLLCADAKVLMSLKSIALTDYLAGYLRQDYKLRKTYALACAYLSKFVKAPRFLVNVSKMPINFCVLITYRCTRACKDCFFLNKLNRREIPDMNLEAAKELEKSRIFRTAIRVGLLGGEPLLNEHVYDIVAFWRRKGHFVSITSNGDVLTNNKARELKKAGLNLLILSYYKDNRARIANFMDSLSNKIFERRRIAMACHSDDVADIEEAYAFAEQCGIGILLPRYTYDFSSGRSLTEVQKQEIWHTFNALGEKVAQEGAVRFAPLVPYTYFVTGIPYCQNALMTYIVGPILRSLPVVSRFPGNMERSTITRLRRTSKRRFFTRTVSLNYA